MNLRLDSKQLRFRLTQDEVQRLKLHGKVEEAMPTIWGQLTHFEAVLDVTIKQLALRSTAAKLTLHIPSFLVDELISSKPSKDGIKVDLKDNEGHVFNLVLEIDVRGQRAAKPPLTE